MGHFGHLLLQLPEAQSLSVEQVQDEDAPFACQQFLGSDKGTGDLFFWFHEDASLVSFSILGIEKNRTCIFYHNRR